ncbi:hypothetical protein GIB67_033277 [Kingdonia uniflora]|uniref:Uncharacterized protein n=1 Tax=Kingdonia uniflora TaxID=39325 RepID=A0A7J7MQ21_9MAGN|nr:hypothetical protein GIB67_033277 [Kingdonia uniflora]
MNLCDSSSDSTQNSSKRRKQNIPPSSGCHNQSATPTTTVLHIRLPLQKQKASPTETHSREQVFSAGKRMTSPAAVREGTEKATVADQISQAVLSTSNLLQLMQQSSPSQALLIKLPKNLLMKTSTIKNTAQVLQQMPRVISSLDAHMDSGLQRNIDPTDSTHPWQVAIDFSKFLEPSHCSPPEDRKPVAFEHGKVSAQLYVSGFPKRGGIKNVFPLLIFTIVLVSSIEDMCPAYIYGSKPSLFL